MVAIQPDMEPRRADAGTLTSHVIHSLHDPPWVGSIHDVQILTEQGVIFLSPESGRALS